MTVRFAKHSLDRAAERMGADALQAGISVDRFAELRVTEALHAGKAIPARDGLFRVLHRDWVWVLSREGDQTTVVTVYFATEINRRFFKRAGTPASELRWGAA